MDNYCFLYYLYEKDEPHKLSIYREKTIAFSSITNSSRLVFFILDKMNMRLDSIAEYSMNIPPKAASGFSY
jgi:hypothetical protein